MFFMLQKQILFVFLLTFLFFGVKAQNFPTIKPEEAKEHFGKMVKVVYNVAWTSKKGTLNFMNMASDYKTQPLGIVVHGNFEEAYKINLENLKGKKITVVGRVSSHKDRLQIKDPESITISK